MHENKLDKIEAKIDLIQEKISDINVTLASQHESLKLHIRRTELLEKQVKPIEKHVIMVHGVLQFLGFTAIIIGIIEGVLKIKNG